MNMNANGILARRARRIEYARSRAEFLRSEGLYTTAMRYRVRADFLAGTSPTPFAPKQNP